MIALFFHKMYNCDKVVGAEYIRLIWVPDTFFVNEKIALFHQATTENQFLRIMHTGEILRSMRLTIKVTILVPDWSILNNTDFSLVNTQ